VEDVAGHLPVAGEATHALPLHGLL
jgi:hypothetical protein